jgi:FAD/FMN-containing dehydrogenase
MASDRPRGHAAFSHDSIAGLGYDWSRVGDPESAPRPPFKVYLPRDTDDVVRAVKEARALGQRLTLRGGGHSSNDLVLADRGCVLYFQDMNRVLTLDPDAPSVTVQAGASLFEVDDHLTAHGLGLPVLGDHRHLTAGGFASVGGASPASHRFGLFVDTVEAIEYVTLDGDVRVCGRHQDTEQFHRLLTGCGRHGIISSLTLDAIRLDKTRVLVRNDRRILRDLDEFVEHARQEMRDSGRAQLQRGYWIDVELATGPARFGQWSSYVTAEGTPAQYRQRRLTQSARRVLGQTIPRAPEPLGKAARMACASAVVLAPKYQTIQDAERAADLVFDYTVGDPVRWFAAWSPIGNYTTVFRRLYDLFRRYREQTGCFSLVVVLTQSFRSPYLAAKTGHEVYGGIMMICGVRPAKLTGETLASLVREMDDICIEEGALRYLHSPTSKDPERLRLLDPNQQHLGASAVADPASSEGTTSHAGVTDRASAPAD